MTALNKTSSLKALIDRGIKVGTILDVGVHIGTPELINLFPHNKHVLFEPVKEFVTNIQATYSALDFELHNVAISDTDGDVGLALSAPAGGASPTHSAVTPDPPGEPGRTVARRRLDTLTAAHNWLPPYFLKIDVDGHEMAVLNGAAETLSLTSIVMIEVQKYELAKRIGYLNEAGFELYDLVEPCYYDESFWQCDAILIKKETQRSYFHQLGSSFDRALYRVAH